VLPICPARKGTVNGCSSKAKTFDGDDERWVGKDVFVRAVPTDGGDLLAVA